MTNRRLRNAYHRLLRWRENHISEKNFILILSLLVGIFTAFAGLLLKWIIHFIQQLLTHNFEITGANFLYLLYPVIGIFITGIFIRRVVRDDISHGITKILYAISMRKSRIKLHNTWTSVVASGVTIGFGGSVGAEAPIVLTGSAIGSNLGRAFKMEHRTLMLLVGCGAAGAIAGIFKAPIAGLVFTVEVLMIDLTMASLLPLLISCVTAAAITYMFTGFEAMFSYHIDYQFALGRVPHVILLGVICGLVSLYFIRTMNFCENIFSRYRNPYLRLLIGGAVLSVLLFIVALLYGEGYDTIGLLLDGHGYEDWGTMMNNSIFYGNPHTFVLYMVLIILMKVFATSATNGGGGCGGTFAPTLFLGCITGFAFSYLYNGLGFTPHLSEKNFALFGMAGLMSGIMHAPLTGIFLIAELTGGYNMFFPLMIVSVCSYLTIMVFEPHSIYAMRLARKGELLTHNKDKSVLLLLSMDSVIETDFDCVHPNMDLGDMVKTISKSHRNVFPVVNSRGELEGIVLLDDIRNIMFRRELYHRFRVSRFMTSPPAKIRIDEPMEKVMRTFDDTKAWNLPVIDQYGKYCGFVSKSKIFNAYRDTLVKFSSE